MSVPAQTPISGPYIANGITTQFAYNFYLIYETDIRVWVGGILKTLNTDFTVTGVGNSQGGNIEFIVPPADTLEVLIKRATTYARQTDYADNGDFLADVVNEDFDRLWLAMQEIFANFSSSLSKPVGGNWNAQGLRITAVKDGVQPQDAATINQLNTVNGSAGQSASAAAASAVAAALSEQHALTSENAAKLSENNAKTSENNAKTSENNAKTSETNAKASETNAAASELSSSNSKVAAQAAQAAAEAAAAAAQSANPDNQLKKAENLADLPDKSLSRDNLGIDSKAHIRGLNLSVSTTTVSISAGAAAIPSTGKVITVSSSGLTATIGTTTASTWYHIYLYDNAGTTAVEISTTDPVAYAYPAHQKTGDASRRYLGSFRTTSGNLVLPSVQVAGECDYTIEFGVYTRILTNGFATTWTAVSLATAIPVTAFMSKLQHYNQFTSRAMISSYAGSSAYAQPDGYNSFLPITAPQLMYYRYLTTPTGGLTIDVAGYKYAR